MKEACWKLVGADCFILRQSARKSQIAFLTLGLLYAFLATVTFISFFGLFVGVLQGVFIPLIGAFIFTFIISNLYRLVIITLEPSTLPVAKEHKVKFWAYFVRLSIVVLLAVFISKVIETMLFGHWVDGIVEEKISHINRSGRIIQYRESALFVEHLKQLNIHYPLINLMTVFIVTLYVIPVVIKHRLKKRNQYYQTKRLIDKQLVEVEYRKMLQVKEELLKPVCAANYRPYQYVKKYKDEPFNIRKINTKLEPDKNHNDFLSQFD